MFDYYFTFQSISRAQQALLVLKEAGLHAELVKTPKHLSPQGCSYALKLQQQACYPALLALRKCKIHPQRMDHMPVREALP